MTRYGRIAAAALAAALVLAACGGGDDTSDAGSAPTDADDGSNSDGGGGDSGSVTTFGNIPGLNDECTAVANLSAAMGQALTGTFGDIPDDIVDALPSAARADGKILADALNDFVDGLEAEGIDLSAPGGLGSLSQQQIEAFSDISERVFNEEVEDAVDRLSAAVSDACAVGG